MYVYIYIYIYIYIHIHIYIYIYTCHIAYISYTIQCVIRRRRGAVGASQALHEPRLSVYVYRLSVVYLFLSLIDYRSIDVFLSFIGRLSCYVSVVSIDK